MKFEIIIYRVLFDMSKSILPEYILNNFQDQEHF